MRNRPPAATASRSTSTVPANGPKAVHRRGGAASRRALRPLRGARAVPRRRASPARPVTASTRRATSVALVVGGPCRRGRGRGRCSRRRAGPAAAPLGVGAHRHRARPAGRTAAPVCGGTGGAAAPSHPVAASASVRVTWHQARSAVGVAGSASSSSRSPRSTASGRATGASTGSTCDTVLVEVDQPRALGLAVLAERQGDRRAAVADGVADPLAAVEVTEGDVVVPGERARVHRADAADGDVALGVAGRRRR